MSRSAEVYELEDGRWGVTYIDEDGTRTVSPPFPHETAARFAAMVHKMKPQRLRLSDQRRQY